MIKCKRKEYGFALYYKGTAAAIISKQFVKCQIDNFFPAAFEKQLGSSDDMGVALKYIGFPAVFYLFAGKLGRMVGRAGGRASWWGK